MDPENFPLEVQSSFGSTTASTEPTEGHYFPAAPPVYSNDKLPQSPSVSQGAFPASPPSYGSFERNLDSLPSRLSTPRNDDPSAQKTTSLLSHEFAESTDYGAPCAAPGLASTTELLRGGDGLLPDGVSLVVSSQDLGFDLADLVVGPVIGSGSFGTVHQALHKDSGRFYAVKRHRCHAPSEKIRVQKLVQEVETMLKLEHANIVQYFGLWADPSHGRMQIVLEYVSGGSLLALMHKYGALTEHLARRCIRDAAQGLAYLHEKGIIHRDVKPANILFAVNGVKLADFGGIYTLSERGTLSEETANLSGTPAYMAPEVVQHNSPGRKQDVWALGCTLMHTVTGNVPWAEARVSDVLALMMHVATSDRIPHWEEASLSPQLNQLLRLCLSRDPAKRPSALEALDHPWFNSDPAVAASDVATSSGGGKGDCGGGALSPSSSASSLSSLLSAASGSTSSSPPSPLAHDDREEELLEESGEAQADSGARPSAVAGAADRAGGNTTAPAAQLDPGASPAAPPAAPPAASPAAPASPAGGGGDAAVCGPAAGNTGPASAPSNPAVVPAAAAPANTRTLDTASAITGAAASAYRAVTGKPVDKEWAELTRELTAVLAPEAVSTQHWAPFFSVPEGLRAPGEDGDYEWVDCADAEGWDDGVGADLVRAVEGDAGEGDSGSRRVSFRQKFLEGLGAACAVLVIVVLAGVSALPVDNSGGVAERQPRDRRSIRLSRTPTD